MGTFANVPQDKYDSLSPEDKKLVDDWRNQENDIEKQEREAGEYGNVISRDGNKSVDKPATRKTTPKNS